ncbi:hypothetical protein FHW36_101186 [Chitinophaga polysaccharea]|uniref:Uncharacterized protein n=1 Tax=Chitinophaga polysaccharea TaxID=1293035 RepID=A0A561Q1M6_9BACT|nr:hypothetical protein FHW36_101186 [Chitinophaga polysaccharea]
MTYTNTDTPMAQLNFPEQLNKKGEKQAVEQSPV